MSTVPIVALCVACFVTGMAVQPYAVLLFEWLLFRPRRADPPELCKGCVIP